MTRLSPSARRLLLTGVLLVAAFLRLHRIDALPPGDGHDPAYYGVDALRILDGARPLFLESNFGREAMFSYLVAAWLALLDQEALAIHLASAGAGLVTVALSYPMGRALFARERGVSPTLGGVVCTSVMALSYWHLNWSRYGVRAILVPLFATLCIYLLWRGFNTGRRRAFAAAGLALGLSLYTYQAARLLPVLVVLSFVYRRVTRRAEAGEGRHLALLAVAATLVFAPLGVYFLTHPGSFSQRIDQVLVLDRSGTSGLARQVWETVLMFGLRGDTEPYATIPGRPALNPFLFVAFLMGIVVALGRIKRPKYPFLLTWLLLMSVPATLAQSGPAAKRAIGALPAVALLITLGLLVPYDALRRRARRWAPVALLVIGAGLSYTAYATYHDYFVVWAGDPDAFTHFEVGLSAIGEYVARRPAEERIYISPVPATHPGIVLHSRRRAGVKDYNGRECTVLPPPAHPGTTYVIVPREDERGLERLAKYLPAGAVVDAGPLHYGQPYFRAYHVPPGVPPTLQPTQPVEGGWAGEIELLGYDLQGNPAGTEGGLQLTLYYRARQDVTSDYTAFVQLWGPHNPETGGPVWAQVDSEPCRRGYPTSAWAAGETVVDRISLPIPNLLPPGSYQLVTGFYRWPSLERLPPRGPAERVTDEDVLILKTWVLSES